MLGIHNKTAGVIFDVFECLIQRNFGYATGDVRACYRVVKQKLYDANLSKIILVLHSQGAIEGGLVLDWLVQELPQDLLGKIEVYTFGSAANHFNDPYRHESSQKKARDTSDASVAEAASTTSPPSPTTNRHPPNAQDASPTTPLTAASTSQPAPPATLQPSSSTASASAVAASRDRVLGHVEHYAHTTDFVAIWGILHFVRRQPASPIIPRFMGRVFVRSSERGGHQFCQHYLDGMFPLARDASGGFIGCSDDNAFMETVVQSGVVGSEYETVREAVGISYLGDEVTGPAEPAAVYGIGRRDTGLGRGRRRMLVQGELKVKDLSRLWLYRNGKVPVD